MEIWIEILRWMLIVSAAGFLVSGLDDLYVDLYFYIRRFYRWLFVEPKHPRLTEDDLRRKPEQGIAVMIPAWDEHAVIAQMLDHTLRGTEYRNYEIFVGTYPNDERTMLAVAAVQEKDPRVHRIVCPHDGPTNKADCLNWVFEGIRVYQKDTGRRFEIFMMHDSEDLVHPLSLKLMNYLIPRVSMVQLPVVPLERPLGKWTAGTYLDEFGEFHTKDLLVRECVAGMVPGAGVGTGFSREALEELGRSRRNQIFNVETLTEDYDFGFRLKEMNRRSILLQFGVERTRVVRKGWFRKREELTKVREIVATREYFPVRMRDAVRQKSRWIFGIVFQGWKQLGWPGGLGMKYMVWRDRKVLFSTFVNIVGYLLMALVLGTYGVSWILLGKERAILPELVSRPGWLWNVLAVDTVLMAHRTLQRVVGVLRVSDWKQALMSVPRMVWGNILNLRAVGRATCMFYRWVSTGQTIAWAKTAHAFPTEGQLREFKRKLGDLLLEKRLISLAHLRNALEVQKRSGGRLGETLTRLGYVNEDSLVQVLGAQLHVEARRVEFWQIRPEVLRLVPEDVARAHLSIPIAMEQGTLVVAAADPGSASAREWIERNLRPPVRLVLAGRRNLREVIERAYAPVAARPLRPPSPCAIAGD